MSEFSYDEIRALNIRYLENFASYLNTQALGHYRDALRDWLLRREWGKPTNIDPEPQPPRQVVVAFDAAGWPVMMQGLQYPSETPATAAVVGELGAPYSSTFPGAYTRGLNDNAPLGFRLQANGQTYEKREVPHGPFGKAQLYIPIG